MPWCFPADCAGAYRPHKNSCQFAPGRTSLPQDGRFKMETAEEKLSFRVSIMPIYEEKK